MDRDEEIEDLKSRIASQAKNHKTRSGLTRRVMTIRLNQLREENMTPFKETTEEERWRVAYSHTIRENSKWLGHHAGMVASAVRNLAALPPFETTAEEEVDLAITATREALSSMLEAQQGLKRKRMYLEAAE